MSLKLAPHSDSPQLNRTIHNEKCRFWFVLLCLAPVASTASAQPGTKVPTVEIIVAGMKQARVENQAIVRPYTVTRDYKLFDRERQQAKSEVTADMTFVPPGSKSYAIQQANGAGLGETIVRRILANEVEIAKDQASADFSAENYDFRLSREEYLGGRRCYVLELLPRRRAKNLLRGNIWVDAEAHLVHRLEGEPAKPPSWWLRSVRVVLLYGDVGGMWLQTGLEATANVRLLGPHTIVSHDVTYKMGDLAVAIPPK